MLQIQFYDWSKNIWEVGKTASSFQSELDLIYFYCEQNGDVIKLEFLKFMIQIAVCDFESGILVSSTFTNCDYGWISGNFEA